MKLFRVFSCSNLRVFVLVILFNLRGYVSYAQEVFLEVGLGLGRVVSMEHNGGKAEINLSVLKPITSGTLGLDFATGGNFIPTSNTMFDDDVEVVSRGDTRFSTIAFFYRHTLFDNFFVEPRVGYASLNAYVHTNDRKSIHRPNLSAGIGVGGTIDRAVLSVRYQYYGQTAEYAGFKDFTPVRADSGSIGMIVVRFSYRIGLDDIF